MQINEVTPKLKKQFCKTFDLPIKIYQEPYFTDRVELFDPFFDTLIKYKLFLSELPENETLYLSEYNALQQHIIHDIKTNPAFQGFNQDDMNKFAVKNKNLPTKPIYKETNHGHTFISIDMQKANFTALRYYDPEIFNEKSTWEDFIRQYTDKLHWIKSKHLRQVIMGNTNPPRQITYEKHLMDHVLTGLLEGDYATIDRIASFSNDEIVIDITNLDRTEKLEKYDAIRAHALTIPIAVRVRMFDLFRIQGTKEGYYKTLVTPGLTDDYEFKAVNNYEYPFVLRAILNQTPKPSDRVFYHEGLLGQFIEDPAIKL